MNVQELPPGTVLGGYEIVGKLGRGGMAVVYLAQDRRLGRRIALKLLLPALAEEVAFRERFEREMRIAASLEHPNVIPVYEAGEVEGLLYIAMRYVDGLDLAQLMARHGALPPDRAMAILLQVAEALDAAHEVGLVHRDVKPGNVLLAAGGRGRADHAYLLDFGLARHVVAADGRTHAGEFMGTPDYSAPEQLLGMTVDATTDVYALASMAFETLVGEPPFRRDSPIATAAAQLSEPPPRASELRPSLPGAVDTVLSSGLAKERSERPATCRSLLADLERALADGSPEAAERSRIEAPARPSSEERKVVTVLFCDVVDSRALGDERDPEDIRAVMRRYHEALRERIEAFAGTTESIGDKVMAVFGSPVTHEDDADRAILAAQSILEALASEDIGLRVRIGINTGEALVSAHAVPSKGEATITGGVVNTAARIQMASPEGAIAVGNLAFELTRDRFDFETLPPAQSKGTRQPIAIHRVVGRKESDHGGDADTPFVGREAEKSLLGQVVGRAFELRQTELVTIVGEAGIGKSRLVRELQRDVSERSPEATWRWGRCLPYGDGVTLSALAEIVRAQIDVGESRSPEMIERRLSAAVPDGVPDREWLVDRLGALVGRRADTTLPDPGEAFTAWRRFVEIMADAAPLVLVIEDLHWADPATFSFLGELVERSAAMPLVVVVTTRPEFHERDDRLRSASARATRLTLAELAAPEA